MINIALRVAGALWDRMCEHTVNPFATRWTRPGAIAYRFPAGTTADALARRLQDYSWRGQIVGPHGTGKSTLLCALQPAIERLGRRVVRLRLHAEERRLPRPIAAILDCNTVLVIDGYEQLSCWNRFWLRRICRRRRCGLLVTSHTDAALPTIFETHGDIATLVSLVRNLTMGHAALIQTEDITAALEHTGGNMREAMFRLYDLYERRNTSGYIDAPISEP